MTFSWAHAKEEAIKHAVRREIQMAKNKLPDFVIAHNDEVLDVAKKNYVKITQRVELKMKKHQAKAIERRNKQK